LSNSKHKEVISNQKIWSFPVPERTLKILLFVSFVILLFSFNRANAQLDSVVFDTKGVDFRLAFLPNYHNNYGGGSDERSDSIYIFIVADKPTTGKIEYKDRYGNDYLEEFTIPNPNQIYTFKLSHYDFEVGSYNRSGDILDPNDARNQCEKVAGNSFHITTDNEVTVYAHSQAVTTSDAFLVLPTDVLGREYIILSYNSDGSGYTSGYPSMFYLNGSSTPSQFLIVASEDNTTVTISPSTETYRHGRAPFTVNLNKGQVYLVQAKITETNLRSDLTGTIVESDKPIAIFSGQQRALVPVGNANLESRDYIAEQMLPVNTWGQNAYVIPYVTPPDATSQGTDIYRVIAGRNGTDVNINGVFEKRLDRGEFFEKPLTGSATIEASGPILVAEYKKTAKPKGGAASPLSDPFMMLVPPKEQFMAQYSVINTQAYEKDIWSANKVYDLHYIAIVAPFEATDKTVIDAKLIDKKEFKLIQGSNDYYYANIAVSEGPHRVSSGANIGVYVYGFGGANSYGYVGGMSMTRFDFKKPGILSKDSCYMVTGTVFDNRPGDTKLISVATPDSSKENVDVTTEPFGKYADEVNFRATLKDIYLDGKFEIFALDSVKQDTSAIYNIPGFTVSMDTMKNSRKLVVYTERFKTNRTYCKVFHLSNYGKFHHILSRIYFSGRTAMSFNPIPPFDINPSESFDVEICFFSAVDTVITDTLYISDGCSDRGIMLVNLVFKGDDKQPDLSVKSDSCRTYFEINVADTLEFDSGIDNILTSISNCTYKKVTNRASFLTYVIEVIDPYKDARFSITVTDSAGNQVTYADTIQGFTLSYPQFDSTSNLLDYGMEKIGTLNCDTLLLHNSGTLPYVVDNLYLKKNIYFSIPQYQLPMVIAPGQSLKLDICFNPNNIYDKFLDTLVLTHNCLSKEIALAGLGDTVVYFGDADCNVKIRATAHTIDKKYELEQATPNPVINNVKFTLFLPENDNIRLIIYDLLGNEKLISYHGDLKAGKNEIELDMKSIPQGIYFYQISSSSGILTGKLIKE